MAATIPNIAKGRINELVRNVDSETPNTSRLLVMLLQDTSLVDLDTLRDYETFAAILGGASSEVSVASYDRLVLDEGDITAPSVNHTTNEQSFDIGDFSFGALEAGQSVQAAVIGYVEDYDDGSYADSAVIPLHVTRLDAAIPLNGEEFWFRTPNGLWSAQEPS